MIARRRIAILALLLAGPVSAEAAGDPRVDAFRGACIPDRQDYEATRQRAGAEGWAAVAADAHPELKAVLAKSTEAIQPEDDLKFRMEHFGKSIDGRPAFLVVTEVTSEVIDMVGCYFYDFEAEAPVAPELLNGWLGEKPAATVKEAGLVSQQWDTPETLPGTWDVYNTYVAPDSTFAAIVGFTGVMIKIGSVDPKDG